MIPIRAYVRKKNAVDIDYQNPEHSDKLQVDATEEEYFAEGILVGFYSSMKYGNDNVPETLLQKVENTSGNVVDKVNMITRTVPFSYDLDRWHVLVKQEDGNWKMESHFEQDIFFKDSDVNEYFRFTRNGK